MHVNVQTRFNAALSQEAPYYRFKESYRDIRGNCAFHHPLSAEWLCKQTIDKLGFADFLRSKGWTENKIRAALSHLIARTIYSQLEGNMSDPKSLPQIIETLALRSPVCNKKTLVVIDAGISTENKLKMIKEKGFNYLCVVGESE